MRRMRGPLQWLLLVVGIVVAGYGVRYSLERSGNPGAPETLTPPVGAHTSVGENGEADQKTAKASSDKVEPDKKDDGDADDEDDGALDKRAGDTSHRDAIGAPSERVASGTDFTPSATADTCTNIERPGASPQKTEISGREWTQVMARFHEVKADLRGWLGRHHGMFTKETLTAMTHELDILRLQRPPTDDMPDLSWRGIGVWTRQTQSSPAVIKLGGGFIHALLDHPARGKFELARLAAQTWVPCELQTYTERTRTPASVLGSLSRVLENPWARLTSCLGAEDQAACAPGSYSEAGWAVSSAIASQTENPGCTLPAFKAPGALNCLTSGIGAGGAH